MHLFNLVQFETIIYIDSDTVVLDNIDALFQSPFPFAAVGDPFCVLLALFTSFMQSGDENSIAASGINGGIMVFKPSQALREQIYADLPYAEYSPEYPEQSWLNNYFLLTGGRLPAQYNILIGLLHEEIREIDREWKILHYANVKPWSREEGWRDRAKADGLWFRLRDDYNRLGKSKKCTELQPTTNITLEAPHDPGPSLDEDQWEAKSAVRLV